MMMLMVMLAYFNIRVNLVGVVLSYPPHLLALSNGSGCCFAAHPRIMNNFH